MLVGGGWRTRLALKEYLRQLDKKLNDDPRYDMQTWENPSPHTDVINVHEKLALIIKKLQNNDTINGLTTTITDLRDHIRELKKYNEVITKQAILLTSFANIPLIHLPSEIEHTIYETLPDPIKRFISEYYTEEKKSYYYSTMGSGKSSHHYELRSDKPFLNLLDSNHSLENQEYIESIIDVINDSNPENYIRDLLTVINDHRKLELPVPSEPIEPIEATGGKKNQQKRRRHTKKRPTKRRSTKKRR